MDQEPLRPAKRLRIRWAARKHLADRPPSGRGDDLPGTARWEEETTPGDEKKNLKTQKVGY